VVSKHAPNRGHVLKMGVIKATPNRKCYMLYVKMCMLDSNFWCLNVEIMHSAITCLGW